MDKFGKNISHNIIISAILFTILLFFYILTVGSFFKPEVYPLVDRVTYSTPFVDKYFINKYYDHAVISFSTSLWFFFSIRDKLKYIFSIIYGLSGVYGLLNNGSIFFEILPLLSLPIILFFIMIDKINKKCILSLSRLITINYISAFSIIIAIISLSISITYIVLPQIIIPPVNYLYYIFLLSSIFAPILLVGIGLFIPIRLIIKKVSEYKKSNKHSEKVILLTSPNVLKIRTRIICMIFIILLSLIIIWIPHMDTINKDNQMVGADSLDYANFLIPMNNSTNLQEFFQAFVLQLQGDRSLSLISFYLISQVFDTDSLLNSMELLPFFLGPLLIITIYFLTMELTSNPITSLLSSFITAVSFQVLVGIYGGLYANWFSLIFANLAILFLIRSLNKTSNKNIAIFSGLLVIVLLSHEPTWPILSLILLIFFGVIIYLIPSLKKTIFYLFLGMIPSFVIEAIRMVYTKNSGVIKDISFASNQGFGLQDFSNIWNNLVTSTQTYLAGQFGNSIIFVLVIYWLSICNLKEKSNILLIIFISIIIIPILIGDSVILSRVLYEIPFQIPAAIALTRLMKNNGNIFVFAICLWLTAIAIRSVTNFYFSPS